MRGVGCGEGSAAAPADAGLRGRVTPGVHVHHPRQDKVGRAGGDTARPTYRCCQGQACTLGDMSFSQSM